MALTLYQADCRAASLVTFCQRLSSSILLFPGSRAKATRTGATAVKMAVMLNCGEVYYEQSPVQSAVKMAVMLNFHELGTSFYQVQSAVKMAVMLNLYYFCRRGIDVWVQSAVKMAIMLNPPFVTPCQTLHKRAHF